MKTRIAALLNTTKDTAPRHNGGSGNSGSISVGTFHSFCAGMLRTYGSDVLRELAGSTNGSTLDRDFTIYDRDDSLRLLKALLQERRMGSLLPKDVLQLIARRKTKGMLDCAASHSASHSHSHNTSAAGTAAAAAAGKQTSSAAPQAAPVVLKPFAGVHSSMFFRPELEVLFSDYTAALRASNALDFDDLVLLGWRLLRDYPAVRRRVQRRYQHGRHRAYRHIYIQTHLLLLLQ